MPTISVGDESIYYTLSPSKAEKALVLIHGSGGNHTHWPAALRDRSDIRVFAPELPGHGRSTGAGRDTVADYAEIVAGFVNRLGLTDVILAGHSLGGAIVQLLALASPLWLSGIVLVGTGARLRASPEILDGMLSDPVTTLEMLGGWAFSSSPSPELVATFGRGMAATDPAVIRDDFMACDAFDVMEEVSWIRVPTLVVSADEDELTPVKYGRYLSANIPGAQFALIEGAGHMMALEQSEEFMQCLNRFLNTVNREEQLV